MGRVAIFIDGGYLDYVLRDHGLPRVDYQKLASVLAGKDEILRTYFYHCLPYQSPKPIPDEAKRLGGMQAFLNALSRLDRYRGIVTGDCDFLPAISTAKNEGVSIQRTIISNQILESVKR